MGKQSERVDAYIRKAPEYARGILEALREGVHRASPLIEEDIKWGMPAFMHKGIVANMAAFKNHVSFGFWKGQLMQDPKQLFENQDRTQMTALKLSDIKDVPPARVFDAYVREAVDLNVRGVKLPVRSKKSGTQPDLKVPADLRAALAGNQAAKATFDGFSYTNKKEYIEWLTEAKREATRARRLLTAVEWMAEGKSRNWKYTNCGK